MIVTLPTASKWLAGLVRVPVTLADACCYLDELLDQWRMLLLYNRYFPAELAASTADTTPREGNLYSDAEWEFFHLVHERLFPLSDSFIEDSEEGILCQESDRLDTLPIYPAAYGAPNHWDLDPNEIGLGWAVLMALTGMFSPGEEDSLMELLQNEIVDNLLPFMPPALDNDAGVEVFTAAGAPLSAVPLAVKMLAHNTGTAWLDCIPESPIDLGWTEEGIDFVIEDWREARAILDQVNPLISWLDQPENVLVLLDKWHEAQELTAERRASGVRVGVA